MPLEINREALHLSQPPTWRERSEAALLDPTNQALLRELSSEQASVIFEAIASTESPLGNVDWQKPADQMELPQRLHRLARVKSLLTPQNIEEQKDQHNISLENYIKLLLHSAGDTDTLRIFLDMALAALSTTGENQAILARQALLIWAPAAEIGGWYGLKTDLEEAAFACLYPDEKAKIIETYAHYGGDEGLEAAIDTYREGLGSIFFDPEIDLDIPHRITARMKSHYSIWRKRVKDGRDSYFFPDFFGVRVIIDDADMTNADAIQKCYEASDILSQYFEPISDRYKDYIRQPMPHGYQAIHLGLRDINGAWLEVQVKTESMHQAMEDNPNNSHVMYEARNKITPGRYAQSGSSKIYNWRGQAERTVAQRSEQGQTALEGAFDVNEIIFSYDGNVYELQPGDTALDFAFAVHSKTALETRDIFINGRPASFDQPLRFGDVVAIHYDPNGKPTWTPNWTQLTHSKRATQALRRAHKAQIQQQLVASAEAQIEQHFRKAGVANALDLIDEDTKAAIAQTYGLESFTMVLREAGARTQGYGVGRIINAILQRLESTEPSTVNAHKKAGDTALRSALGLLKGNGNQPKISILGTLECGYHIAGCCTDGHDFNAIVATLCPSQGDFSIHKVGCANVPTEKPVLPAAWVRNAE